jgi:mono/diheme cytochrome c family protein
MRFRRSDLLVVVLLMLSLNVVLALDTKRPGLGVTFTSATKVTDSTTTPNLWLYVSEGTSPTAFLPEEKFTASWNGFLGVDLRGDFTFQAEMNGSLKLEINGQTILEASTNGTTEASKSIRLGKGATNVITATFESPSNGDAFIRLFWKPRDGFFQPIPVASVSHTATAELTTAEKLRHGRALVLEHRCVRCHSEAGASNPELAMDSPSFENIGARRNYEWMTRWISNPRSLRPDAAMPKLLHGEKSKEDAEAIGAFLASLKPAEHKVSAPQVAQEKAPAGKKLFESLHCGACHNAPDSNENAADKISLKQTAAKFQPGTLEAFLKQPEAHYAWIRMPRFNLDDEQRTQLAAYILSNADAPSAAVAPGDAAILTRGKELVQNSGCLNCHSLKLENRFSTKPLAELTADKLNGGCLAEKHAGKTPDFGFAPEELVAVREFLSAGKPALARYVSGEFAERHVKELNCAACHGKVEGVPALDPLGGKLKPEWMAKFMAGEIPHKPRPWLEAQMPAFPAYATNVALGLATRHGFPPSTLAEPGFDPEAQKIGHNLVSNPPLGFACVSCHSVGTFGATQVFEAPGINLAQSGARLQPSYFKRWLRNPPLVDPQTKMPAYFDEEGRSPITDVYEGDGLKQIDALWQYVRLGEKMPAPKTE